MRFATLVGFLLTMIIPMVSTSVAAQDDSWKTTVYPGGVVIENSTCDNGIATPAVVSIPSDTTDDGIFYVITQPDAEGAFSITAQVGDDFLMGDTTGTGWTWINQWNASYSGVAPLPDCDGAGPQQQDASTPASDDTTDAPDMGVYSLPQDCGAVPYPAPTGVDVSANVAFSNYVITQNGVTHTGGPISLTSPDEVLTLSFDWQSTTSVASGQYFHFAGPLDTNGNKVFTSATQWFPVMNSAGTAQAGCASAVGGDITVQFTEYVNNRGNVDGQIDLYVEMSAGSSEETTTIDFTFDDDSTFSIDIPGTPSGEFGKRGWFMRDDQGLVDNLTAVRWQLHVPASPTGYTNLQLVDAAPEDGSWTFSCAGESATTTVYQASGPSGPVDIVYTEDCSATAMTLTVPTVPAGTEIDFYFYADITPEAEGPFYNVASASADEFEQIQLPYEVRRTIGSGMADGDLVVTPIPPAVNHAVCVDDVWQPASVMLPTGEGVTYTMSPDPFPAEGGHLVVIATLSDGYTWSDQAEANGWTYDAENGTMVYETDVLNDPCVVETPTPTTTPPVITPTPEEPCVPPTPPTECIPTPTPPTGTPPSGTESPTPCVPGPTPTTPPWCEVTPTPPTVTEFPSTGTETHNGNTASLIAISAMVVTVATAAGVIVRRERA